MCLPFKLNLNKKYDLSNHLGNVMVTVSDKRLGQDDGTGKAGFYLADVQSATDYFPFGSTMPGRSYSPKNYRFGYQGSEKDNDLGQDNYTTHYRLLDTRLGRWFSVDPLFGLQPGWSTYKSMYNNPITWTDVRGGTEEERKKAVAQAKQYIQQNAGYSYGAKGVPGQPVDCSGLISNCIVTSGLANPVGQGTGTGVNQIMQSSTQIKSINHIEVGNAVVIDWNAAGGYPPVGMISEVNKDAEGNVTSYNFIHSSTSKGPTENTVTVGGSGYYDGKRISGWYKWDTPNQKYQDFIPKFNFDVPIEALESVALSSVSDFSTGDVVTTSGVNFRDWASTKTGNRLSTFGSGAILKSNGIAVNGFLNVTDYNSCITGWVSTKYLSRVQEQIVSIESISVDRVESTTPIKR